jgi:PPM family protein phosphatase
VYINAIGKTDVGQKRDHNEDRLLVDAELQLYIVCDGMGGHAAGEVAAEHATATVRRVLSEQRPLIDEARKDKSNTKLLDKVATAFEKAVNTACSEIFTMATADTGKAGMGTTFVGVLLLGGKAVLANVGDSRLYMLRAGQIHQLSEDHSYTSEMVKRGKMTREQARQSPYGNVITRAVGIQKNVQVDTLVFDMVPGDTLLLCSDGLHGYFEDLNELADQLSGPDTNAITSTLIELANQRGGKDNVTVIVLRAMAENNDTGVEAQRAQEVNLKFEVLRKIPIFAFLSQAELVKVLNITYLETCETGKAIVKEKEQGEELYIVLAGRVIVSRQGQDIVELHPGVHFGEMALVDESPRSATVTAAERTRLLVLQRRSFYTLIRKEPVLAVKLLWSFVQSLSRRLRETNEQLSGARSQLETQQNIGGLSVPAPLDMAFMEVDATDFDDDEDTVRR